MACENFFILIWSLFLFHLFCPLLQEYKLFWISSLCSIIFFHIIYLFFIFLWESFSIWDFYHCLHVTWFLEWILILSLSFEFAWSTSLFYPFPLSSHPMVFQLISSSFMASSHHFMGGYFLALHCGYQFPDTFLRMLECFFQGCVLVIWGFRVTFPLTCSSTVFFLLRLMQGFSPYSSLIRWDLFWFLVHWE